MTKPIRMVVSALLLVALDLQAQNRIQFNGQDLFLNGGYYRLATPKLPD